MRPLIALLTDFGTRDPYVAQVKGVIAQRCDAEIIDLTHEIAPYDAAEGAFFLRDAMASLRGARTVIVVAVVDPGVGSSRRLLAVREGNVTLLGPDNGLLSLATEGGASVHEITNEANFLAATGSTFHGRDRLAPVAAALANGMQIDQVGARVEPQSMVALDYKAPEYALDTALGTVTAIDRYGNVATDVDPARLGGLSAIAISIGGVTIERSAESYAAMAGTEEPFLIAGSRGTVEISISGGNAASALGVRLLDKVRARRR